MRAVILDRDGTIIIDKVYLNDVNQIEYLPNAFEGMRKMRDLGYKLIVATNQSGIARGIVDIGTLYEIHAKIRADCCREGVAIDGFYYAPYSVQSNHQMRKPNPGMLRTAARDFGLQLDQCFMIGDRSTDVEAGLAAGTKTIFLNHSFQLPAHVQADLVCTDLLEAACWLASNN